jgi:hypothetical protein
MSAEKQDKIPGYYTKAEYDALYYRTNRLQQLYDQTLAEKQQLEEACTKLTAEHSFKKAEVDDKDSFIVISNPRLRQDLAFSLHATGKPDIVIRFRGSQVYEVGTRKTS